MIWQSTSIWNEVSLRRHHHEQSDPTTGEIALQGLTGSLSAQWHIQMAGAFLTALPTFVVYILLGGTLSGGCLQARSKDEIDGRNTAWYNFQWIH